jgi:hypothetical protein
MERFKELVGKLNSQLDSNESKEHLLETIFEMTRTLLSSKGADSSIPVSEKRPEKAAIAIPKQVVSTPAVSLNETLKSETENISEKLKHSSVSSIADALGVNQRFIFTHVFFSGDSNLFMKALTQLDQATSLQEANKILSGYVSEDLMNNNPDTADQLIELLNRRFLSI